MTIVLVLQAKAIQERSAAPNDNVSVLKEEFFLGVLAVHLLGSPSERVDILSSRKANQRASVTVNER